MKEEQQHTDLENQTLVIANIKLVNDFRTYLQHTGYSSTSKTMLPSCVKEFLYFTDLALEAITKTNIINYYHYIQKRPKHKGIGLLSQSMISQHIYALKLFFSFQMELRTLEINPISTFTFSKIKPAPRPILNQNEIKKALNKCITFKEKAVFALFYGLGIRLSEGVQLSLEDVHFKTNLVYIREGKGKKRRVIPMHPSIANDLRNYIEQERVAGTLPFFLLNKMNKKMNGNQLNKVLRDVLQRADLNLKVSLHGLRHSIATHLLENGLELESVRVFLGHKHLETTQIYARITQNQVHAIRGKSEVKNE